MFKGIKILATELREHIVTLVKYERTTVIEDTCHRALSIGHYESQQLIICGTYCLVREMCFKQKLHLTKNSVSS